MQFSPGIVFSNSFAGFFKFQRASFCGRVPPFFNEIQKVFGVFLSHVCNVFGKLFVFKVEVRLMNIVMPLLLFFEPFSGPVFLMLFGPLSFKSGGTENGCFFVVFVFGRP